MYTYLFIHLENDTHSNMIQHHSWIEQPSWLESIPDRHLFSHLPCRAYVHFGRLQIWALPAGCLREGGPRSRLVAPGRAGGRMVVSRAERKLKYSTFCVYFVRQNSGASKQALRAVCNAKRDTSGRPKKHGVRFVAVTLTRVELTWPQPVTHDGPRVLLKRVLEKLATFAYLGEPTPVGQPVAPQGPPAGSGRGRHAGCIAGCVPGCTSQSGRLRQ